MRKLPPNAELTPSTDIRRKPINAASSASGMT